MRGVRCASCHGEDAKGNPSGVGEFPTAPADLTLLSKENGGVFPAERLRDILTGEVRIPAHHGPNPMPMWGDLFEARRSMTRQVANDRLEALTQYLQSIQQQ